MKKPVELALLAGAGIGLFSLCFVGFAAMSGVPMHTLPLVGALFEEPEPVEDPLGDLAKEDAISPESDLLYPDKPTPDEERQILGANLGVIGSFAVAAPFTRDELSDLVAEIETRREEIESRFEEVRQREGEVESQVLWLQERRSELKQLQDSVDEQFAGLEIERESLAAERAAFEGDVQSARESSGERLTRLAQLFAEGEPGVAASRLLPYGAQESGEILRRLEPERALEVLNALPEENWAEFAEAFTGPN